MFKNVIFSSVAKFFLVFSLVLFFAADKTALSVQTGTEAAVWERFSAFDEESNVKINHAPLTELLDGTVLNVGRSKERLSRAKAKRYRESHITYGNTSPSRYEGNRVMFHAFSEDHKVFLKSYIEGLERLSERRPIISISRDEQLAYWLNLHNLMVLDLLATEYPVKSLKAIRLGSSRQQAQWDVKRVTVEGVPLSIRDIEMIVMKNWDDPRVIYGLYQGSIGGPSLPNYAFEAADVWDALDYYTREFINSNRGVRPKGSKVDISIFYEWNMAAFDGSVEALRRHIQDYADEAFLGDISGLQRINFKYYDWTVADIMGGVLHGGRPNQLGGVLSSPEATNNDFSFYQQFFPIGGGTEALPPQALELMTEILINNDVPRRTPVVTVEPCGVGECQVDEPEPDPEQ